MNPRLSINYETRGKRREVQPEVKELSGRTVGHDVVVTGCQLGDCYYREGNRMIRERLLGDRPPTMKKGVDRRRVLGLWLSRVQPERFIGEVREFQKLVSSIPAEPAAAGKKE
jgi:coenzyme F420-reducing hydrogenase delta subunit